MSASFRAALCLDSWAEVMFGAGFTFSDGGAVARSPRDLQELYCHRGGTEMFAFVSTERSKSKEGEDRSLGAALRRARLAAEIGLPFNPQFGLFATYGDVRFQPPPCFEEYPELGERARDWDALDLGGKEEVLRLYGRLVAEEVLATGARVDVWDVGNEVDFGVAGVALRPFGPGTVAAGDDFPGAGGTEQYRPPDEVSPAIGAMTVAELMSMPEDEAAGWLAENLWPSEGRLLAAFASGVRQVQPGARFSTHLSNSWRPQLALAFWRGVEAGGYVPDEVGCSFYPGGHGGDSLSRFQQTVGLLWDELGKETFVAEYASAAAPIPEGLPWAMLGHEVDGYERTEAGQHDLLAEVISWGRGNHVSGLRYWAPGLALPVWQELCLFRSGSSGRDLVARPAIGAFAEALA